MRPGLLCALALCACEAPPPATDAPLAAPEPSAAATEVMDECAWVGVVVPDREVELVASARGRVARLHGEVGDLLAADALAVELVDPKLAHGLVSARAELQGAIAGRRRADAELGHVRTQAETEARLAQAGIVGRDALDDAAATARRARHDLAIASATTRMREAELAELAVTEGELEVRVPWPARIAARYVEVGATVEVGTPLLRLVASDPPVVRFAVATEDVAELAPGTPVRVSMGDGEPPRDALVRTRAAVPDEGSGAYHVVAHLLEQGDALVPGRGAWVQPSSSRVRCELPALPIRHASTR